MAQHEYPLIDVDDYLTLDRASKEKRYEFVDGELRMLAGGSTYHSRITLNLASTLHSLLSETSCYVYSSDIRLQLSESRYVYPEITVSRDERDDKLDDMIRYPRLIVEVLSPGTEAIDRGKKFLYYRECPTVQEYVMVDSRSILIEVYRREDDGWILHTFEPESTVKLESLNVSFPIDVV
jgi:Uma2 family endonuclease